MTAAERSGVRSTAEAAANRPASSSPTGVATTKPAFIALQQHAGRGQRVEPEEARAGHERERDEEEARVPEAAGSLAGEVAEDEADERRDQDEPEVGRVVLPVGVRFRTGK